MLFNLGFRPEHHAAAAGVVCVDYALTAKDDASGREIRALDVLHQLLGADVGIVDVCADGIADLTEVVRGHIRGHTYGNS